MQIELPDASATETPPGVESWLGWKRYAWGKRRTTTHERSERSST